MAKTVTEKWGHGIYVWMKRVHTIFREMRSNINMQNNKERKNMNRMIAAIYQKKNNIMWPRFLPLKKVSCWV